MEIALDHITADHEEDIKKLIEKNNGASSDIRVYEVEKLEFEKRKKELRKLIKDKSELPKIKTVEMRDFLDSFYAHKKPDLIKLAETSLRHWQQYLLSRENPNREVEIKDITRYVSSLSNRKKNELQSPIT